ncbi:uncharacterized protein H6S33_005528 [Morchella sextelata]|uniref:uncharacterized protein n=1 Tax=Morchella sextelata TaxID=1174677 RepID=UPI001D04244E|nr:uncharacterized protein H6S33_005528 [Morchella sextelata]KAH0613642.1 hypothetical protein H6S33_005528 [Morchella sextelata]
MLPNSTILTTHPTSTPRTHLIYYLFIYLLLFAPPNTALAQVAPFPFPVLPQEFASKTACREVYDQCMQAFRDCLAAVAGNEPGRLGCEAYRNDVCEEHIRVGCDQLPNGGGSIGEVPSLTTLLTVVPIGGTTEAAAATTTTTTATRVKSKTSAPVPVPTDVPTPTPDPPDPTTTRAGTAKVNNNANIHGYTINIGDVGTGLANSYSDYDRGGCDHEPGYKHNSDEGVVV